MRTEGLSLGPDTLDELYLEKEDPAHARDICTRRLRTVVTVAGAEHPISAVCISCIGFVLGLRGELESAESKLLQAVEILRAGIGLENDLGSRALLKLGGIHAKQNRWEEADGAISSALAIEERLHESQQNLARFNVQLAEVREAQGRQSDAKALLLRVFEGKEVGHNPAVARACRILLRLGAGSLSSAQKEQYESLATSIDAQVEAISARQLSLERNNCLVPLAKTITQATELLVRLAGDDEQRMRSIGRWLNRLCFDISQWCTARSRFLCAHPGLGVPPMTEEWYRGDWFMELQELGYTLGRGNTVPAGHSPSRFGSQITIHANAIREQFGWVEERETGALARLDKLVGFQFEGAPALFPALMHPFANLHNMWFYLASMNTLRSTDKNAGRESRPVPKRPPLRYVTQDVLEFLVGHLYFDAEMEGLADRLGLPFLGIEEYAAALTDASQKR